MNNFNNLFESEVLRRRLDSQFFATHIGRIIRDSIYNDFTYIFSPRELLVTGYWETNNISIIYRSDKDKPEVRTNEVWFKDYLTFDVDLSEEDITYYVEHANYRYSVIRTTNNEVFKKEFNAVWATEIYSNGELYKRLEQNIRFVPTDKDRNKEFGYFVS